jgi:phosphoribosylpyrophosphate synthetase
MLCRACQRNVFLKDGCIICRDVRRAIRLHGKDNFVIHEDELEGVVASTIEVLKVNIDRLYTEMHERSPKGNDLVDLGPNDKHVKYATELAKALSTIMTQARALEREKQKRIEKMPREEQARMLVAFFGKMPIERQKEVLEEIVKVYKGK